MCHVLLAEVYHIKQEIEDQSVQYPAYYTQSFHGEPCLEKWWRLMK